MSDNNGPNTSGVLIGLAIGAALGAGLALLLAPRSGKETRELIAKKSKEATDALVEKSKAACDLISQKTHEAREVIAEKTHKITDKASEAYGAAASTLEAKKAEVQAAYEGGRNALHEERNKRKDEADRA